jgi:hypothetical protein
MRILVFAIVAIATPAYAWDGPGMWYRAADDANPGGGGIMGTGGRHDHGIKCTDCHAQRQDEPNLSFALDFAPPLANNTYVPGTRYTVTARMTGAQLGVNCSVPNGRNVDGFATSFEDDAGASAGMLAADDGQAAPSCALPSPPPPGTTALDGDCKVIFANSTPDTTTWTFYWTAPSTGTVHVYWGAVDGACDMMSMNDAAVVRSETLAPAPAARFAIPLALVIAALVTA